MMKAGYINALTKEERAACLKMGSIMAFSQFGITPRGIDPFVKSAGLSDYLNTIGRAVVATALIGGVPIGVAAHVIGKRIRQQTGKEKEMEAKLKYYRAATGSLETNLGQIE